jgi:biopolymer transport protein ExbB
MLEFLQKAGLLVYPLGLCSILASVITIERIFALQRRRIFPPEITGVVDAARPGRDLRLAIDVCRRHPGVFADVIRVGLEQAAAPWAVMRDALNDIGRQRATVLERHLVWLGTIAQVAPLLGLLGTVIGMIKMFASISVAGLGDPQALSGGISEAIVTTAIGLGIGIPTLVAHNLLAAKAETLIAEIEGQASRLVARLRVAPPGDEDPHGGHPSAPEREVRT